MAIFRIPSLVLLFSCIVYSIVLHKSNGFGTKLYHRDFSGSPLYDPTLSLPERVSRAVDRSIAYHTRSSSITPNSPKALVKYNDLSYMMKISLGTPPVEYFLLIDTTSDLTWIECAPCENCLAKNATIFDHTKSSSYSKAICYDENYVCPYNIGKCVNNLCTYSYTDSYGTKTSGDLSLDVFALNSTTGPPVVRSNYVFGCGYDNEGILPPEASGIIGFGRHISESFLNQFIDETQGKFSYCLTSSLSGGKGESSIYFGESAILNSTGVVTTPLHQYTDDSGSGLCVDLEAITIAGERIDFGTKYNPSAKVMINSGTILSKFPSSFYNQVVETLIRHINALYVQDPSGRLALCYNEEFGLNIPDVIATFTGGANIYLDRDNLFVRTAEGVMCLAMVKNEDVTSYSGVWGTAAQTNFFIGFDVKNYLGTLSFLPTLDCRRDD